MWFSVYYLIGLSTSTPPPPPLPSPPSPQLFGFPASGECLPSAVVLVILKDMPVRSREGSMYNSRDYALVVASLDETETPHWVLPANRIAFPVLVGSVGSSSERSLVDRGQDGTACHHLHLMRKLCACQCFKRFVVFSHIFCFLLCSPSLCSPWFLIPFYACDARLKTILHRGFLR